MNNALAILRSALVAFYRTSARHPLYTALNVLGLAFGIAVFIVISLYVRYELTYDRWLPDVDNIYEIDTAPRYTGGNEPLEHISGLYALTGVRTVMPQVTGTRLIDNHLHIRKGQEVFEEAEYLVDPDVFKVFALPLVAGDYDEALHKDGIVISDALARKYFGRTDVVGQTLMVKDLGADRIEPPASFYQFRSLRVTAVFKAPPPNSSIGFNILRPALAERDQWRKIEWRSWWPSHVDRTFLRLESAVDAAFLNARFDALVDAHPQFEDEARRFAGRQRHTMLHVRAVSSPAERLANARVSGLVLGLSLVGFLAIGVALLNYVNLTTARSGLRAREAALRKAMGSPRSLLQLQFTGEACVLGGVAFLFAVSLVELALPSIVQVTGWQLTLDVPRDAPLLAGILAGVLGASALAGIYPSAVLSGYRIAESLKATRFPGGGRFIRQFRDVLILLQFAAVTSLLVMMFGFQSQVRHIQTSDLGYGREGWLFTQSLNTTAFSDAQVADIKSAWAKVPGVKSLAAGPAPGYFYGGYAYIPVARQDAPDRSIYVGLCPVDQTYFESFEVDVLSGRGLRPDDVMRESEQLTMTELTKSFNVVINRRGSAALGFTTAADAVGRELSYFGVRFRVVGVVRDMRMASPRHAVLPVLYLLGDRNHLGNDVAIRFEGDEAGLRSRLTRVWQERHMTAPLVFRPGREVLDYFYTEDRRLARVFLMAAGIVGLVGIIGLYGLAAFSTSARSIEIGLRKAMGATRWSVVRLLLFQFLKPVLLANLIAWPVAYVVLDRWLKQFDDRVALSLWFFLAGSGISLAVAIVTVAGLAFTAAGTTPGKALRHE